MAGQRIDIMELRTLIALKLKKFSNRKVALLLKINRKTVDGYIKRFTELGITYEELYELCESDLNDLFTEESQTEKQRYEELSALFPSFKKEFTKPGCTLQALWKDYIEKHLKGYKYTQFTLHYRKWKKLNNHSGKLEHKAGEKLYIDFCGKKLGYIDKATGELVPVEVSLPCCPVVNILL